MQEMMQPDNETAVTRGGRTGRGSFSPLTALLLGLILLFGGFLRFTGQNWDDFADLHPDERFLTRNLLPLIGGGLEFTDDRDGYPDQSIVVLPISPYSSRFDFESNVSARVGALQGTTGLEAARWWLGESRVVVYDNPGNMLNGLMAGEVSALVMDSVEMGTLGDTVKQIDVMNSITLQQAHCQAVNPTSGGVGGYFDIACSPLNPHNAGAGFYAYGTLPLFIAHYGSKFVQEQENAGSPLFDFQGGTLVWRFFSSLFDCGTILLLFLTGARMHNRWVGLLAALLYAAAPLAVQKAHFGTVNAITTFFVALAMWAAVGVQDRGRLVYYAVFGFGLGAALSGRINLLPLAGVVVLAAMMHSIPVLDKRLPWNERQHLLSKGVFGLFVAVGVTWLTFRLCNPYAFPSLFNPLPLDSRFLGDLGTATFGVSGHSDAPPNYQWMNRASYLFPLKDMLLWGMGIAMAVLAWLGWAWSGYQLLRAKPYGTRNILLFVWVLVYFGYMGNQWVMTMRYYLPLYPALALLAAWAVVELVRQARLRGSDIGFTRILLTGFGVTLAAIPVYYLANRLELTSTAIIAGVTAAWLFAAAFMPGLQQKRAYVLAGFVVLFSAVWALMFTHIYRTQVTRVQASRWVWENIPGDFAMRIEGAPEGTPLVNIAVPNSPVAEGISRPELLLQSATRLQTQQPFLTTFIAPADGTITGIYAPHLTDADADPDAETLYISISGAASSVPLGVANLTTDLNEGSHILGNAYTIPLDVPVQVQAGVEYSVMIEALSGTIASGGSVVVTEGDWDDRITSTHVCQFPPGMGLKDNLPSGYISYDDCNGRESWTALVSSYDQAMSYPIDDYLKRDSIVNSLNVADFLTITSNRFYDTEWRNRVRWPLTGYYYDALFRGELGFDLVAMFDESYELGPLSVSDQHFPVYTSPAWMNEWEADEAFHVYDHPAVFIFKKRADFDPERVAFQLNGIPLLQMSQLLENLSGSLEARLIGVIYWSSIEADQAPTALMLPPDVEQIQQQGGTWSERFNSFSILNTSQPVGVAAWWLAIMVFGWLTFPLLYVAFPGLADRGYSIAKFAGMFLVAFLAWAASSAKIPLWSQSGIFISMALVALLSALAVRKQRGELREYVRENWKRLAWIEVITLALFLGFVLVRLTNPDLWHDSKGGEKPMDFSMFNAVLRSTVFPPYDAWYSGGFINYYYFGFVLVGSPVLLLQIVPSFAYNLIVPTLFALTGIGAFSAAFNIVHRWRERPFESFYGSDAPPRHLGSPWAAGIVALLLCVVLGNLDTIRVLGSGLATLGGYEMPMDMADWYAKQYKAENGTAPSPDLVAEYRLQASTASIPEKLLYEIENSGALVSGVVNGIGKLMGGATLPIGGDRWYWGPSRVLAETPGVGGNAITEMPYFTFLYADLHAHMIDLPVLLFVIAVIFNEVAVAGSDMRRPFAIVLAIALGAMCVGMMEAINTWDWPSFLLFSVVGLSYAWWLRYQHTFRYPSWVLIRSWGVWYASALVAIAPQILGEVLEKSGTTSSVPDIFFTLITLVLLIPAGIAVAVLLLSIFNRRAVLYLVTTVGGFLVLSFVASYPYTTWYAATYGSLQPWTEGKTPLWAYFDIHGLFLFLLISLLVWDTGRWMRSVKVKALRGKATGLTITGLVVGVIQFVSLVGALANYQVVLVVIPLILWIIPLFFRRGQSRSMQFVLVLMGFGLALTLGVEIIVLGGDIGRQNTVFKFYMQTWLLFSVAAGAAFAWLTQGSDYWSNLLRLVWYVPLLAMFLVAGMYPIMATRARALDRMAPEMPVTLNGMDYMQYANHILMDYGDAISLKADYDIIRWLQENVKGTPVILEGRSLASEYRYNTRITINTGLPSVLGWNFHERQQRTFDPLSRLVEQRELNVKHFYNSESVVDAVRILRHYGVSYVIVSEMEQVMTTPAGLAKFDLMVAEGLLRVAFRTNGGKVYEVVPEALDNYAFEHQGEGVP